MADATVSKAEDSAEKAYAAAAEAVIAKDAEHVPIESASVDSALVEPTLVEPAPVEFPPKAKRARKPRPDPAPEAAEIPEAPEPVAVTATPPTPAAKLIKPRAKSRPVKAPVKKRKVSKTKAAPKTAAKKTISTPKLPSISQLKDKIMASTKTPDFAEGFKGVIADVKDKAKSAFEKGSAVFGEANDFTKGNVEAFVESGKILAAGLQDLSTSYVAEGRSAFETLTADVKELTAAKSPTDFFKLQSDLVRRNFDSAVALGSKNSEAFLKLASEAFAPISGRVSLAVEKVKTAA